PEEYAPLLVEGGFVVPAGLAELFGASVRAAGAGVELTYQGRSLSFALEGEPRALLFGETIYVPLRTLADFLHLRVSWDLTSNTLDLSRWTVPGALFA